MCIIIIIVVIIVDVPFRSCFANHGNNLYHGGASDDRIVHQEHVLALHEGCMYFSKSGDEKRSIESSIEAKNHEGDIE